MQREDEIRIRHMLDAAKEALSFIEGQQQVDLIENRQLVLSLIKCIEIVGEAATRISKETREQFDTIPWRNVIGMRNRLIHAYFDINLNVVWKTVTEDLPPLVEQLTDILKDKSA